MTPTPDTRGAGLALPGDSDTVFEQLKRRMAGARAAAQRTVNTQLIELYRDIGRVILDRQRNQGWGAKVIARLGEDLRREFPSMRGLSASNLNYMRGFAAAWPSDRPILRKLLEIAVGTRDGPVGQAR